MNLRPTLPVLVLLRRAMPGSVQQRHWTELRQKMRMLGKSQFETWEFPLFGIQGCRAGVEKTLRHSIK